MKTAALVLAALLVASGPAFAGNTDSTPAPTAHAERVIRAKTNVALDRTVTNSTIPAGAAKDGSANGSPAATSLSINPWIVPSFH